ncbi:MAG TPA: GNAT family N-acetyltransferase [Candidatus Paceibacterota bacterium]|nr:GNAT family N-acetyltransferase [Candidatus Paceibacterota bacterium]
MEYKTSIEKLSPNNLGGFFVGWKNKPSIEKHLAVLQNSNHVVLAINDKQVVGYITAITDKTLSAYIPFLEVLPKFKGQGIGKELVYRMLAILKDYYMIDLLCDTDLQKFYEKFDMKKAQGMCIRNYSNQNGDIKP